MDSTGELDYRRVTRERLQIVGLFSIVLIVRILAFLFSKNEAYDCVDRIIIAQEWVNHPFFMADARLVQQHLVMPIYLIGIGIWNDPLITPRVINLIIGSLTAFPFFLLVRLVFDKRTAIYSTLFFSFFTLHVRCSVIASSEAPFIFFLLFALYFLFKFRSTDRIRNLIYSAFLLNLACMTRYIGWIYMPLLFLLVPKSLEALKNALLFKTKTINHMLIFGGISSAFPIFWMTGNYMSFGDPLYPVHITTNYTMDLINHNFLGNDSLMKALGFRLYYLAFWPAVVFLSMTPVVAAFSAFGIGYSIYKRKHLAPIMLIGAIYLWFLYKVMTKTFILLPRFTIDSSILALPFAVIGMNKILFYFNNNWRRWFAVLVPLSVVTTLFAIIWISEKDMSSPGSKLSKVSPVSRLAQFQEDIISFLNANTGSEDKVILDHDRNWAEKEIIFYSNLDMKQFITRFKHFQGKERFLKMLRYEQPKYVILSINGYLAANVSLDNVIQSKYGFQFKQVLTAGPYVIYAISYGHSDKRTLLEEKYAKASRYGCESIGTFRWTC